MRHWGHWGHWGQLRHLIYHHNNRFPKVPWVPKVPQKKHLKSSFIFLILKAYNIKHLIQEFIPVTEGILSRIHEWEPILQRLTNEVVTKPKNSQGRCIKQILGHLIDSASNNTHRIVHLQYQASPFQFPNYATDGNNDRWIAIQNYMEEDWLTMVQLWKYAYLHVAHVMKNVNPERLNQQWISGEGTLVSLKTMIVDFLRHLDLHLGEIKELMNSRN